MYKPEVQKKEFEKAIVFLVKEVEKKCYNKKPVIIHSLKVGFKLMELKMPRDVVIAGFLHDLVEDTACTVSKIEKSFGKRVAKLVGVSTYDPKIKNYKERWRQAMPNIVKAGKDAMIIKLADNFDNLPYYTQPLHKKRREEVLWKQKLTIISLEKFLKDHDLFKEYKRGFLKVLRKLNYKWSDFKINNN